MSDAKDELIEALTENAKVCGGTSRSCGESGSPREARFRDTKEGAEAGEALRDELLQPLRVSDGVRGVRRIRPLRSFSK